MRSNLRCNRLCFRLALQCVTLRIELFNALRRQNVRAMHDTSHHYHGVFNVHKCELAVSNPDF